MSANIDSETWLGSERAINRKGRNYAEPRQDNRIFLASPSLESALAGQPTAGDGARDCRILTALYTGSLPEATLNKKRPMISLRRFLNGL